MASDALSREVMRDRLATLLAAKLVSGGTQYAFAVSNGKYDGLAGQSPVVMLFSLGSRRVEGGLGTVGYQTWVRLQIQVWVRDADSAQSQTQQDVEDTLDTIEKLIADVVADNRSDSGYWDYLRHAEEYTVILSQSVGGNNYQTEIINLEALDVC